MDFFLGASGVRFLESLFLVGGVVVVLTATGASGGVAAWVIVEVGAVWVSSKGLGTTTFTAAGVGAVGAAARLLVRFARLEPPEDPAASVAGGSRKEGEVARCLGDQSVADGGRLR